MRSLTHNQPKRGSGAEVQPVADTPHNQPPTATTGGHGRASWENVTRSNPCPVCGKDSWCSVSRDGKTVVCRRIESNRPARDSNGDDYWIHHLDPQVVPVSVAYDAEPNPIPCADIEVRDSVYRFLLDQVDLADEHRQRLQDRGFDDSHITQFGYKTLAHSGRDTLAHTVRAEFPVTGDGTDPLAGVPGLHYRSSDNKFTVGGWEGILIPVRTVDGSIQALKTRADDSADSSAKYRFVSSRKHGGATPGSPVHIPLHPGIDDLSTVRLTEGELKADLATAYTGTLTISVPGVSSWRAGIDAIRELPVSTVLLAFDADANEKPQVQRALRSTVNALLSDGYDVNVETWAASDGKGIDDLLAGGGKPKQTPGEQWLTIFGDGVDMPGAASPEHLIAEPPVRIEAGKFGLNDTGNAERLAHTFGADLRYNSATGEWLVWDDTRFVPDTLHEITRRATQTAKWIAWEAEECKDRRLAEETRKWSHSSLNRGKLTAMIELARSQEGIAVNPNLLDRDPYLFNVENGTIDLHTGKLKPHSRDHMATRKSPVIYDPDARLDMWDRFLAQSFGGDVEVIEFVQRLFGYSLLGVTPEELLPILIGTGGSGKSTMLCAFEAVFGDYGRTAEFDTFLQRSGTGGARNDLARLAGARLAWASEMERGKKLSSQTVKSLTGSDPITARFLYKEAFTFRPAFLLVLVSNDAPRIDHDDEGMWRRVVQLKMDNAVPEHKRDPRIKETLRDPHRGGPAVLAWLVKGCQDYLENGMQIPESVRQTTREYRAVQDPLYGYLGTAVVEDPNAWSAQDDLYAAYVWWTEQSGEEPMTSKQLSFKFGGRFQSRQQRRNEVTTRGRIGLKIIPEVADQLDRVRADHPDLFA